jgi:DNA-binding NarL/FixJ family response regulator
MRAGASGFLLKDAGCSQLVNAVGTVAAGDVHPAPSINRRLVEELCRRPAPGEPAAEVTRHLSPRELEVMRLVGKGVSNAEIASRLYLSNATVKSHVVRVLAKLGQRDRIQVVVLAYETGIAQPAESR